MSYLLGSQEQQIILRDNRVRQKGLKHQLLLLSTLNLLTFLCFVFAMAFYQWVWVQIEFKRTNLDSKVYRFWINLLYMKEDKEGSSYQLFFTVQQRICMDNIYCLGAFYEFTFVGYTCFSIFFAAGFLQVIQIWKKVYYAIKMGKIKETRNKLGYVLAISTYIIGLTLFAFSIYVMDYTKYQFGVSYWLCAGALVPFIIVIIYGHFSVRRMVKQAIIQSLLDKQQTTRCQKILRINTLQQKEQENEGVTI